MASGNVNDFTLVRLLYLSGALNKDHVTSIQADFKHRIQTSKKPLEERLVKEFGVNPHAIDAVKRACWEENTFGKVLEAYLKETGKLNKDNYDEFKEHLDICAEEQKAMAAEGEFPPYIGELMAKRKWINNKDISIVLKKQGMIDKIKAYVQEEDVQDSFLARQELIDSSGKLKKRAFAYGLVLLLAVVGGYKILKPKPSQVDSVMAGVEEQPVSEKRASYSAMVQASYSNFLEHVKRKEFDKANDNLDEINTYVSYINKNDPNMKTEDAANYGKIQIIVDKTEKIDLSEVKSKDVAELIKMKPEDLERLVIK